ncbi:MAG: complex I NDUFA9 subunit family protein [Anaerolineales bacterium]
MILVTGATGFVGRALVRQLSAAGKPIRALIRPSKQTPRLPQGVNMEAAVVSLSDARGLRAALRDVEIIFHLAGEERYGAQANLKKTDVEGTKNLVEAASDAGVDRLIYLSHLGAASHSAYPVLQAKGAAEEYIRKGKTPYTIFRSSLIYGVEDRFTNNLARLIRSAPGVFPLPAAGRTVIQPIWVEDVVTCMTWTLDSEESLNKTYEIGGSEFFTLQQIIQTIMDVTRRRRILLPLSPVALRGLTVFLQAVIRDFPISSFWLDYFAVNRTCAVDALPRQFGLMPARFTYRLDYLVQKRWYQRAWDALKKQFPNLQP